MLETLWRFGADLQANVRVADVLDVAIIAVCLYYVLIWLRRRSSRPVAAGVLMLSLLFVVARRLDMFLTSLLFQAGLTALLVALVLVFQEDIRRAFERLAAWSSDRDEGPRALSAQSADTLVEVVSTLADRKIGALVVLTGRESLERHVRGGVPVGGRFSLPLLYSIFHPASPGHDGAVIVEGERIAKLGAHLPLSKNLTEIRGSGTRHAAALGLAERCDALVIVVSEERGTISIAEHGRLERAGSLSEVKERIDRFYAELYPETAPAASSFLTHNLHLKAGALGLACLLWLAFGYHPETVQRAFNVPIEYRNLPGELRLVEPVPRSIEVTLAGPARIFELFDPSSMVVSLDLSGAAPGQVEIPLSARQVNKPSGLSVFEVEPTAVELSIERRPGA